MIIALCLAMPGGIAFGWCIDRFIDWRDARRAARRWDRVTGRRPT